MSNTILSYKDYQIVKPTTINDEGRLTQFIFEVETYELCKVIGRDVYLLLLEDAILPDIDKPVYFQTIYNGGLKQCIAFLVYAKYCREGYLQDTFSGLKTKVSEYSQQVNSGNMKNIATEYSNQAIYWLELVKDMINKHYVSTNSIISETKPTQSEMIPIYGSVKNKTKIR